MLIRCIHCFTPFTMTEEAMYAALDEVEAKGYKHYNAYCPRCGRPNMVARAQLEREAPGWAPRHPAGATTPAPGAMPPMRPAPVTTPPAPHPASSPTTAAKVGTAGAAKPKPATKQKAAPRKAAAKKPATKKAAKAKATKAKSIAKKKKTGGKKKK
ncbi:MAG: hypothetical protein M1347_07525 [Chloroflexi bacterium]|nr:hypothetical protein [Chloroflexota bacterium]